MSDSTGTVQQSQSANTLSSVPFTITDPASNATVQQNFCVTGTIDGGLGVAVTVTLTVPGHLPINADATVNAVENTWEVCFSNAPVGNGASVEASYPGAPLPLPRSDNITIQAGPVSVERLRGGGDFSSWSAAEGEGTYDPQYTLSFYITQAGANLTGDPQPLADGEGDAAARTWKKGLAQLVRKGPLAPGANYVLHVEATKGDQTVRAASGFFKVK
jgi:hypothetical protein